LQDDELADGQLEIGARQICLQGRGEGAARQRSLDALRQQLGDLGGGGLLLLIVVELLGAPAVSAEALVERGSIALDDALDAEDEADDASGGQDRE
jgi:hypothetical protein